MDGFYSYNQKFFMDALNSRNAIQDDLKSILKNPSILASLVNTIKTEPTSPDDQKSASRLDSDFNSKLFRPVGLAG